MPELLEDELRQALATRAGDVTAASVANIRARDYRPRTRSVRSPVAAGALVSAAGAATAAAVLTLGTQTPEAFAGWTAKPTSAAPSQVASAEASCRRRLAAVPPPPSTPAGKPRVDPGALTAATPVLTDTRGPFTFVIFATDSASASCITGPGFTSLAGSATSGSDTVPDGRIGLTSEHLTNRGGRQYSFAEGRTGAGVSSVTLVLSDGTDVTASSANGWFVAWWPGARDVASARVTGPSGTVEQQFSRVGAPPCPPGASCVSRSSGGASPGAHASAFGSVSLGGAGGSSGTATSGGSSGTATSGGSSGTTTPGG